MNFTPSPEAVHQFDAHEARIVAATERTASELERQLTEEANLEKNNAAQLTAVLDAIYSNTPRDKYPIHEGRDYAIHLEPTERILTPSTSKPLIVTPWLALPNAPIDVSGLTPEFRYVRAHPVRGPIGEHSTRDLDEFQIRWVREEFISDYEVLVKLHHGHKGMTIMGSPDIYVRLQQELDDAQRSAYDEIMSSVLGPLADQLSNLS